MSLIAEHGGGRGYLLAFLLARVYLPSTFSFALVLKLTGSLAELNNIFDTFFFGKKKWDVSHEDF